MLLNRLLLAILHPGAALDVAVNLKLGPFVGVS